MTIAEASQPAPAEVDKLITGPVELRALPEAHQPHHSLVKKLGNIGLKLAFGVGITGASAIAGGIYAYNTSTHADILIGGESRVNTIHADYSVFETGVLGNVCIAHANSFGVGARITPSVIDLDNLTSDKSISLLSAGISDPKGAFEEPVVTAVEKHLEDGALTGAILGGLLAGGIIGALEKQKRHMSAEEWKQLRKKRIKSAKHFVTLGGIIVGTSMMSGDSVITPPSNVANSGPCANTVPLTSFAQGNSFLKDISVTRGSALATALSTDGLLTDVLTQKATIDNSYKDKVDPNLARNIKALSKNPAAQALFQDKSLVPIFLQSDLHCSIPYNLFVAPAYVKDYAPYLNSLLIVNVGDTMISSDTYPFEPYCVTSEQNVFSAASKAMHRDVYGDVIEGDDDSPDKTAAMQRALTATGDNGKSYLPFTVLDKANNYTTTESGLVIVGGPDPIRHIDSDPPLYGGKAANQAVQKKAMQAAGNTLAKAACKAESRSHQPVILLVHALGEAAAGKQSGCVATVLSAESTTPNRVLTSTITTNKSGLVVVHEYDEDASSGVDWQGFTLYTGIENPAYNTIVFVQKGTNKIAGLIQTTINKNDSVKSKVMIPEDPTAATPSSVANKSIPKHRRVKTPAIAATGTSKNKHAHTS